MSHLKAVKVFDSRGVVMTEEDIEIEFLQITAEIEALKKKVRHQRVY